MKKVLFSILLLSGMCPPIGLTFGDAQSDTIQEQRRLDKERQEREVEDKLQEQRRLDQENIDDQLEQKRLEQQRIQRKLDNERWRRSHDKT